MSIETRIIEVDTETKPKSAIAYYLGQAILAIGKDDLKRCKDSIKNALVILDKYIETRGAKKK